MNDNKAKEIVDKIFKEIFGDDNPYAIEEIKSKFAFDIRIPIEVRDATTNEITYTSCINAKSFISNKNMEERETKQGWMRHKVPVKNLQDILNIWNEINYMTTERIYDSDNVFGSDPIYRSNNVYRSTDCGDSNNLIFCDGIHKSSYVVASQRSANLNYCLRVDDSNTCTNSYNVICSAKISNSLFIQDCSNLYECIFCSHISNKEYCIANMQFSEEEYFYLKGEIIKWILSNN